MDGGMEGCPDRRTDGWIGDKCIFWKIILKRRLDNAKKCLTRKKSYIVPHFHSWSFGYGRKLNAVSSKLILPSVTIEILPKLSHIDL